MEQEKDTGWGVKRGGKVELKNLHFPEELSAPLKGGNPQKKGNRQHNAHEERTPLSAQKARFVAEGVEKTRVGEMAGSLKTTEKLPTVKTGGRRKEQKHSFTQRK